MNKEQKYTIACYLPCSTPPEPNNALKHNQFKCFHFFWIKSVFQKKTWHEI